MKILHHDTSDIEKVIAKSNHLQAASLKGAALLFPWQGRGAGRQRAEGHSVAPELCVWGRRREELEISRVNTQRDGEPGTAIAWQGGFLITVWN